ncbi:MAG TPA: DNA methyltransferase, partial [Anaerolineales bacterium]|nr:DNA methyltransferase [Anaerolineales bacterium]
SKSDANKFNKIYTGYSEEYLSAEWRKLPSGRYYKTENMLDPQGKMKEYDFMGTSARWRFTPDKIMELWNALQTEVPDSHGRIKLGRDGKPIKRGRIIFLDEMPGVPLQDIWDDINYIAGGASEALGYPTQKPLALLERIVMSSSNEGDVLLDPFCGCGTAIAAAQKLNRRWIGIDITHLSITLMKFRLKSSFSLVENKDYVVVGEPESIDGARQLAKDDRYQFQWWALSLIQAKPLGGEAGSKEGKKGSDKGIDGVISFINEKNQTERILIQVKSGHVKSGDVRDLRGVVEREDAAIGVFITLEEPSKDMITEAVSSGYYRSALWQQDYPRIQILTIKELLDDKTIHMPKSVPGQFKQAEKIKKQEGKQGELGI